MYYETEGDLIKLAREGNFNVIAHGCNCYSAMGAGIAPQMANAFGADTFPMEADKHIGDINKLGTIDFREMYINVDDHSIMPIDTKFDIEDSFKITVVNAYTQYNVGPDASYEALALCMRKINRKFEGKRIGLPLIGCGIGGLNWTAVKPIIQNELRSCFVTVVHYKI